MLLAACTPGLSQASVLPLAFEGGWYLALDQRYYAVDPGTVEVGAGDYALKAASSLLNCRRATGAAQLPSSNRLTYANGAGAVYLSATLTAHPLSYRDHVSVLELTSASGDIVCDGDIPDPFADAIYSGGFE